MGFNMTFSMMHSIGDIVFYIVFPAIAGWAAVMIVRELES